MEDPGITRLNIDHYRRMLKRDLDEATRERTLALLAEAEERLIGGAASRRAATASCPL